MNQQPGLEERRKEESGGENDDSGCLGCVVTSKRLREGFRSGFKRKAMKEGTEISLWHLGEW